MLAESDSFYHLVKRSLGILQHALSSEPNDRLYLEGASYVVAQPEFSRHPRKAHELLKGLDNEQTLLERIRQDIAPDGVQIDPDARAATGQVLGEGAAAVGVRKLGDDGEAEAAAATASGRVAPVEALEDAGQRRRRDPRAVVRDREDDVGAAAGRLDPGVAVGRRRRRQRVLDEVAQDPLEGAAVGGERDRGLGHARLDHLAGGRGGRLEAGGRLPCQGDGVELLDAELGTSVEVGQGAELLDETFQTGRLLGDRARRSAGIVAGRRSIGEGGGETADDGERRAQVVAHVGDEIGLGPARARHLGGHGVEGGGHLLDLARPLHGKWRRQLAPGERAARLVEAAKRATHRAGQEPGERRADPDEDEGDDRQRPQQVLQGEAGALVGKGDDERPHPGRRRGPQRRRDVDVPFAGCDGERAPRQLAAPVAGLQVEQVGRQRVAERHDHLSVGADEQDAQVGLPDLVAERLEHLAWRGAGEEALAGSDDERAERVREAGGRGLGVQVAQHQEEAAAQAEEGRQPERHEGDDDAAAQRPHRSAARRRHEPVADAADRLDRRPVVAEAGAHGGDVDVDGARLTGEVGSPDVLQERVARVHDARVAGQRGEKVELARAKIETPLPDVRLAPARVDAQVADLDRAGAAGRRVGPAKDGADAGDQLARVERLGDVVVGAQLEPDDRVDVLGARGQHDDRRLAATADLAAHLPAVQLGEHQVEDDERWVVPLVEDERLATFARGQHLEALLLEVEADEIDDVALVVDDQDRLHRGRGYAAARARRRLRVKGR